MAEDANAQIRVDIDTTAALASIKSLQRQISAFHSQMLSSGNAANAALSQNMQKTLVNSINATGKFSASLTNIKTGAETFTTALEKNKLGLREYFRYAGASTKSFGKLFTSEFSTIEKVARERVKTLQTQYIKMGRDANGALQAIKVRPLSLDMQNLGTQTAMAAQKQMLLNQLIKQGTTNLVNWGKNVQWAGRQLMVGFTIPLAVLGSAASKTFMELEKQAVRFKRVYGGMFTASGETEKALEDVRKLADEFTKYGVAVEKTLGLAADLAQQGLAGVALLTQVTQATRLAVLGEVEQQEALKTTISITNAFGIAADDLASKINFLNAVENETITAIEDLTIAIPKAGPVVKQLGGEVEDLAFFLTAMKEGGINASEGANALKSGLASLINPSRQASDMLAGFGINIKGIVEANKGDVRGTVIEFARALDELDPLDRARSIEQLFGKFQFSRISTLFQNVIKEGSQANRVLELSQQTAEELAVLADRELKRVEDSPAFKFQKAIEDISVALAPLGEQFLKLVTPIVEFVTGILKKFNEMSEGSKTFVTGLIAVLGLVAPVVLMTVGLVANGVGNLIKGFNALRLFYNKLGGDSNGLASSTQYLTQEQLEAAAVAASLGQSHAQLAQIFTSETQAVQGLIAAYQQAVIAANALSAVAPVARARPELTITTNSRGGRRVQAPQGYADGVLSVPGPKGAGDVVPAMLSPGEAVIPAEQTKKYGALIAGIVADNIPGYARSNVRINIRDDAELTEKELAIKEQQLKLLPQNSELTPAQIEANKESTSQYKVRPAGFKKTKLPSKSLEILSSLGPEGETAFDTLSTRVAKMGLATSDQAKILGAAAEIAEREVGGGIDGVNAYIESVTKTFEDIQDRVDSGETDLLKADGTIGNSGLFRDRANAEANFVSKNNPSGAPHLAHANEGIELTGEEISRLGEAGALRLKAELLPALAKNPGGKFGLKTAFGMANFDGPKNQKLDGLGISSEEMIEELDRTDGVQRWATSVEAVDGNVAELSEEMLIFDNSLKSLVRSLPAGSKIFDSQAKVNEARARNENAYSVTELTSQALMNTGDRTSNLRPVLQKAAATVTDISGQGVDRKKATLVPQDYGNPIPQMAEKARQDFARGIPTEELQKLGAVADVTSQNISDQSTSNSNLSTSSGIAEQDVRELGNAITLAGQAADAAAPRLRRASSPQGAPTTLTASKEVIGANKGLLSVPGPKGAGDVVPAMLSPGEAVIPAKMAARYAPFIQDMIAGNIPGFMSGVFLGMPKSSKAVSKGRVAGDEIYELFKKSSYANTPPTEYGHQISPTSGHSFPIFNLGGVYQKGPKQVFVKPMMDEVAALAEMRATTIARQAHGLKAPEQRIVVIRDPMDIKRERRFLALESDLDPTFVNTEPMGVFNEEQYFRQLVASLLRADKDLSPGNVYGDVVADVGPAGVFDRASGFRQYSSTLPSMEDQALINLLGIKGGAKRAFAESTLGLMAGLTPEQYHQRMIAEIQKVLPRLKETIASFKLTNPTDVGMYDDMVRRLEAGLTVDWRKFHTLHSKVEIAKPKVPKVKKPVELARGVVSVPGPKGAGDVVPAMLSPGEAVIPAAMAEKYGPLINSMISDNVPGYRFGLKAGGLQPSKPEKPAPKPNKFTTAVGEKLPAGMKAFIDDMTMIHRSMDPYLVTKDPSKVDSYNGRTQGPGTYFYRNREESLEKGWDYGGYAYKQQHTLGSALRSLTSKGYLDIQKATSEMQAFVQEQNYNSPVIQELIKQGYIGMRDARSGIMTNFLVGTAGGPTLKKVGQERGGPERLASLFNQGPKFANGVVSVPGPKGAGDVVPAMLSPGEAVIPTAMVRKYGPLINSMISDNVPGYMSGLQAPEPPGGSRNRSVPVPGIPSSNMAPPQFDGSNTFDVVPDKAKFSLISDEHAQKLKSAILGATQEAVKAAKTIGGEVVARTLKGSGLGDYTELADGRILDHNDKEKSYANKAQYDEAMQARELAKKEDLRQRVATNEAAKSNLMQTNPDYSAKIKEIEALDKKNSDLYGRLSETELKRYRELKDHVHDMENLAVNQVSAKPAQQPQKDKKKIDIFGGLRKSGEEMRAKEAAENEKVFAARENAVKTLLSATDQEYKAMLEEQKAFNEKQSLGKYITDAEREAHAANQKILADKQQLLEEELRNADDQKDLVQKKLRTARDEGIISDEEAVSTQGTVVTGLSSQTKEQRRRSNKERFRAVGGRISQVGMMSSMAVSAASAVPGVVGETAQKLAGPVMAISSLAMFIQGPWTAGIVALIAIFGAAWFAQNQLNEAYKKGQTEAVRLAEAIGGSTDAIRKLSEFSGKVTAGEASEKRREGKFRLMGVAPGKTTFGESFMQDESGQALIKDLKMQVANDKGDTAGAMQATSSQLSMAVVSGALTKEQAGSIASQIGLELNDASFAVKVRAEISELIGPDGTDLANNELVIATRLADTARGKMENSKAAMNTQLDSMGGMASADVRTGTVIGATAVGAIGGAAAAVGAVALAAAAVTAFTGGVAAPLAAATIAIAAGVGAVVGGVTAAFGAAALMEEQAKKAGALAGAYVADLTMALQQQNEIKAVLDQTYLKKLDEAAAEGDITEYKRLQLEYDEKRLGLTQISADLSNDMIKAYDDMIAADNQDGADAVMSGLKNAADVKYAEDPTYALYKDSINASIAAARAKEGQEGGITGGQEVRIRSELLSGMDPSTLNTLLNSGDISKVVSLITNLGGPMATEVGMVANMIKDKDVSANFLLRVEEVGTDSVEAQRLIDLATNLQALGGEGVMENSVNTIFTAVMDDSAASGAISDAMDRLDETEVETVEQVYEIIPEFNVDGAYADAFNEEYFATLQTNAEKETYVLVSKMIMEIPQAELIASPDFIAWRNDKGARYGPFPGENSYAQWQEWYADDMAQKVTTSGVVLAGRGAEEPEEETGGGGGPAASPLDDMLKRLRDVRKSQIGVTKGFDASSAAIDKLFGGDRGINMFDGLEQSMRKFGAGEDLISAIAGMDPEEFDKKKNLLFNFDKQTGAIIGFKEKLMNIGEALSAIALGEYVNNQQKSAKESKNQVAAFNQLRASGYSVADAYEAVQDASVAAAIASGNVTREQMQTMLAELKAAQDAMKEAARLTPEGLQEVFQDGFSKAMEAFEAEEKKLTLEFDLKMKDDRAAIKAAENEIAKIRYEIDDYEASLRGVADQEKTINKTYDEKLEALEKVRVANQKVLDQEKGKLSVAEAISRGDLAATARAAQDLRATSASGYFSSQTDALNAGRKSALDQVRGEDGLSRIELEERIEELTKNIFEIEEKTLEPAQERIRLGQIELDKRIEELEVLGKTKTEWETIKNNIDVARVNSAGYKEAMAEALVVVQDVLNAWNGIQSKEVVLTTIQKTITEGQASAGSTSGNGKGNTSDPLDPALDTPAAQANRIRTALNDRATAGKVSTALRKAAGVSNSTGDRADALINSYLAKITKAQADNILREAGLLSGGGGGGGGGARGGPSFIVKASGGPVSGPGTGTSDSIPAMLSNGEYVIKAESAKKLGRRFLDSVNAGKPRLGNMDFAGGTPGFYAPGGPGGMPTNKPAFSKPSLGLPSMGITRPPMPQIPSSPRFSMPFDPGISKRPVRLPDKQAPANNNSSVYNYNLSVNVASQSDPNTIAQTVMAQLQRVESQRVRNGRF
jgi:TP901 family phage tail tape measure protein